jgi:glucuronate isomerase
MKKFLDPDFLLNSDSAKRLYHDYAAALPIIDYHCHLPPKQIAENHGFENLTEIWLRGDHYKWRAMRMNGVDESFITGNKTDWKNSRNGLRLFPILYVIPCIIGRILNCNDISAFMKF